MPTTQGLCAPFDPGGLPKFGLKTRSRITTRISLSQSRIKTLSQPPGSSPGPGPGLREDDRHADGGPLHFLWRDVLKVWTFLVLT